MMVQSIGDLMGTELYEIFLPELFSDKEVPKVVMGDFIMGSIDVIVVGVIEIVIEVL